MDKYRFHSKDGLIFFRWREELCQKIPILKHVHVVASVAVRHSKLHTSNSSNHTATWCNRPHCNTLQQTTLQHGGIDPIFNRSIHAATHCNTIQQTATDCNRLQQTATDCNRLQHTSLQHTATDRTATHLTATHCNRPNCNTLQKTKLQHTATHCNTPHCNTLQYTAIHATHCNTPHYNTLQHT